MAINQYSEKDGKKYFEVYLNTFDRFGKRLQIRRRGYPSLREARTQEFELKRQLSEVKLGKGPKTWEDWHKICLEQMKTQLRPSTLQGYEGRIAKWVNPAWKKRDLHDISSSEVHDLVHNQITDTSPNSRRTLLKMIKRLFQMAVEDGILDRNPAIKVKVQVPEVKQAVLNATEIEIFLREAKNTRHRFYEIWAMALLTGMRSGELYALKWSDVDLENNRISVNKAWCSKSGIGPTKTRRMRIVPVSAELKKLLLELKLKCPHGYEHVLPHRGEWTQGVQAEVTREFCESIGITSVKFHDLRASFITQMLLKGVPLAQVMAVVGHTQIKTTNVYLRVAGSDLNGVTEKLGISLPEERIAQIIDFKGR